MTTTKREDLKAIIEDKGKRKEKKEKKAEFRGYLKQKKLLLLSL